MPWSASSFRVAQTVVGTLAPGDRFTLDAPGGELEGMVWHVPGSPRFQPGEFYLMFLNARPTGEWVPIAMAYVAPGDAQVGTMLDVAIRDQRVPAEVVTLPFYRRPR